MQIEQKRIQIRVLLFLTACSLILRLIFLGRKSLWGDEAFTFAQSVMPLGDYVKSMLTFDIHGPLASFLPRLLGVEWTSSEWYYRLIFCLFGWFSVPLVFAFCRKFGYSIVASFIATLIVALSPVFIQVSQEGRHYSVLLFLFLAGTVLLQNWFDETLSMAWFAPLYLTVSIAGIYTDFTPFLGFLIFHWCCFIYLKASKNKVFPLVFFHLFILFSYLPLFLVQFQHGDDQSSQIYSNLITNQIGRLEFSPFAQLSMFLSMMLRAVHALVFPTFSYLKTLEFLLHSEQELMAWGLFFLAAMFVAIPLAFGVRVVRYHGKERGILWLCLSFLFALLPLSLLSSKHDQPFVICCTFLLPLFFLSSILMVPILSVRSPSDRNRIVFSLFLAVPLLLNIKALLPLDPRHALFALLFICAHCGEAIERMIKKRAGKIIVVLLGISVALSLVTYYRATTHIFNGEDNRSACSALALLAQDSGSRSEVFVNLYWGGQQAVRYYLDKSELGSLPVIYGPLRMEDGDAMLPDRIMKSLEGNDRVFVLTKLRLEETYYRFLARVRKEKMVSIFHYGDELVLIMVTNRENPKPPEA